MNGPARLVICCAIVFSAAKIANAQATLQPTPQPIVTAEAERWHRDGNPVMFAGNVYYPAGPQIHFNGNEMVRSGTYQGVPLYSRTTIEPYSVVYVPLPGGLMQPCERRREGDIAGTGGSSAPSFPVATSRDASGLLTRPAMVQAAAPPMLGSPLILDDTTMRDAVRPGAPEALNAQRGPVDLKAVGTSGYLPANRSRTPVLIRRAQSPNGIFVEFDNARWFSSGPPAPLDTKRLTRIGQSHGFPVYANRGGERSTIYIPVGQGTDFVAPYSTRK